ncbi:MAG: formate--tetrahydrofolate ligase [Bacilli bacterium]
MLSDLEINNDAKKLDIKKIATKLGLNENNIELYGNYKAKVNFNDFKNNGKLILVTSINPTPYGEGKTTVTIGINDALRKLGLNSIAVLREPSLGPVFGLKGGATGGGYSQVVPMEDINLHFTGDIHAITSCNNLLCALIDNHIYWGNKLNIDPDNILVHRCLDINDRSLRNINIGRKEKFNITAASEIMSIFCLAQDFNDLKVKLENILIGFDFDKNPIFVKQLECVDALAILLKDAFKPNLVQSLENNPILIHGGPFANVAHGCNSLVATKTALSLCDYVITEAGFGADLGFEKFIDIKCRNNIKPNLVILNITLKAIKHNGYLDKELINLPNIEALKKGIINLETHIENISKYNLPILVSLNKYETDTLEEIEFIKNAVLSKNVEFYVCESYSKGSLGAIDLANAIINKVENNNFKFLYELDLTIKEKTEIICKEIYRAKDIIYFDSVLEKIELFEKNELGKLPICISKTPYSFSDNPKILGSPKDYKITVTDINIYNGAGFITIHLGNVITIPGLSKEPAAINMTIDNNMKIHGLF